MPDAAAVMRLPQPNLGGGGMGAVKLRAEDRALLDLLCLAAPMAAELDRLFRLRPGAGDAIDALRNRGLVAFDSLRPSPSALAAFADRQSETASDTNDTPPPRATRPQLWTPDEHKALAIAHQRGLVIPDLAAALGRPYWSVCKHAQAAGLKFGRRRRLVQPITLAQLLALDDESVPLPATKRRPQTGGVQAKRWDAARRERFLAALEATGSIDAASEAAGLKASSRGAAYRQKHRDPEFSAAWDAALKRSPYRPGRKPRPAPAAAEPAPARAGKGSSQGFTAEETERLKRAHAANVPFDKIAADLGRSESSVYRCVRRLRLPRRYPGWSEDERRALEIAHRRGVSLVDVALALGRKYYAVAKWAETHRISFGRRRRLEKAPTLAELLALDDPQVPLPPFAKLQRPPTRGSLRPRPRVAKPEPETARAAPKPVERPAPPEPSPAPRPRPKPGGILARAGACLAQFDREPISAPRPRKTDAEISAEKLRYIEERKRMEALCAADPLLSLHDAKLRLQRRGRVVCRASMYGGPADRWYVAGLGKNVTDAQLVEAAKALPA